MLTGLALFALALAGAGFFFQHALSVRDRPLPEEGGQSALLEEHCGARIERGRNFTSPFVRLTIYDEFLVVSCLDYRRSVRYGDIARLDEVKTLLGSGLALSVHDPEVPKLTLWVRNVTRLKREILRAAKSQELVV